MAELKKTIFVTGASGCIGSYVLDFLLQREQVDIHLLVRDLQKIPTSVSQNPHVFIHLGSLETIEQQADILSKTTHLIHIATAWGDSEEASQLNMVKTLEMFDACNPAILQRIIYFSTASILGAGNKVLEEAQGLGTGYIRSKYRAYMAIKKSAWANRVVTIFPTLVFGGDAHHPSSHISGGILSSLGYAKWIRFFYMDATFHFMHAKDIAAITDYALDHELPSSDLVVGQGVQYGQDVIKLLCQWAHVPIWFQLKITPSLVFVLAKIFRVNLSSWDRFCISNPHFSYNVVSPDMFGLPVSFLTLKDILEDIKRTHTA